jgi:hypothetical protein
MTPTETVVLTEYVRACCPQQHINEYTPDAWYDILGDLSLDDCTAAVATVAKRQPFVAPAEIRAEVRHTRDDRLAREITAAPPPELADEPGRYKAALDAGIRRIADGRSVPRAIGAPVREDDPPPTWAEARAALPVPRVLTPQEKALQQAAESRAAREAADGEDSAA